MTPPADLARYKNHRFPGEIISHGVWLYYRFSLSYRDVEEMLFARGIVVTHEAIRQWCRKFGQDYANQLKRRRAQPGDKWHLDEVFLTINGKRHYLWRAMPSTPGRSADETTTRSPTGVGISAAPLMPRSVVCLPVESARATTCAEASLPCTMMAPHPAERRGEKTMLAIRVPHNEVEVALRLR